MCNSRMSASVWFLEETYSNPTQLEANQNYNSLNDMRENLFIHVFTLFRDTTVKIIIHFRSF